MSALDQERQKCCVVRSLIKVQKNLIHALYGEPSLAVMTSDERIWTVVAMIKRNAIAAAERVKLEREISALLQRNRAGRWPPALLVKQALDETATAQQEAFARIAQLHEEAQALERIQQRR